jgi:hypothetical protein
MAIDFLGTATPPKRAKLVETLKLHQPEKEAQKMALPQKVEASQIEPAVRREDLTEVNLMSPFKAYLRQRRLEIILISIIVILIICVGALYLATRLKPIIIKANLNTSPANANMPALVNENSNINQIIDANINQNENFNQNENLNIPIILPPPLLPEPEPQIPLNTELAPLRGSLVKFSDNSEVYLIEWQGELRLINQQTVVFKSKQTISSLSAKNQIYLINSNFKSIRRGADVIGYVNWDPRILSPEEIESFK